MLLVDDDEIKTEVIMYLGRMNSRRLDKGSNKQVPVYISLTGCVLNLAVIDSTSGIKPPDTDAGSRCPVLFAATPRMVILMSLDTAELPDPIVDSIAGANLLFIEAACESARGA